MGPTNGGGTAGGIDGEPMSWEPDRAWGNGGTRHSQRSRFLRQRIVDD